MSNLERILYVEDDQDIQTVAKMALELIGGFEVKICSSGQEALDVVEQYSPDFILLDVMMPGIDGPTTLSELRKLESINDIPIAFMTAKVQPDEVKHLKSIGAVDVIAKPFDPTKLANQVRDIWTSYISS